MPYLAIAAKVSPPPAIENAVERAVVLCRGEVIEPARLPLTVAPSGRKGDAFPEVPGSTLDEVEKFVILKTLEHAAGSTSRAAEILGVSVRKIQYKLQEFAAEKSRNARS